MRITNNDSTALKKQEQVELAGIFRLYADDYRRSHAVSYQQLKVMHHILCYFLYAFSEALDSLQQEFPSVNFYLLIYSVMK